MAGTEVAALRAFRAGLYGCLGRRRDALFEVVDALLTPGPCPSLPHLSLAPGHRRGWGSVYAALRRGHVHVEALRALLRRQPLPAGPPLYAMDVSVWPRADAATSPERGYQYHSPRRRRAGGDPVVPGWAYQWLVRLSPQRDSWTAPVDVRRVGPEEKPTAVAAEQLQALVAAPPADDEARVPLVLFDAGYDACGFTAALAGAPVALLIRLRSNRHFWFAPDPATQPPSGRPKRHGAKFVCNDPATWPGPHAELRVADEVYGPVDVRAWAGLHTYVRRPVRPGVVGQPRGPRRLTHGTVVRLEVGRLPGRRRTPAVVWLWWQPAPAPGGAPRAPAPEALDRLWRGYCRRADLEQTFRFLKQTLRWVTPRVRLPEQADRWTWLVLAAYTQLRLARGAVADHRLPWERPLPPARLTPARVQQGFATLAWCLPPIAAAPKPHGRSPGRPKGRRSAPAARYPPVKKAA
jgi:DDE superfamily endonuclease